MKTFYTTSLAMILAFSINAQSISGLVTDQSGIALPDAVVYIDSYSKHTHSNEQGAFKIKNAKSGDTLHVQYIGFEKFSKLLKASDFDQEITIKLKESDYLLDQVYIDNALNATNTISKIDLIKSPVNSSQEILQKVPGLFIAQHAGGGKAEQIFLRGFDIDHGTDIAISVDGMPVNMVSHAHGQGYADLHFLIPETIENIDFGKGPYYADKGNLNTAGYVDFATKRKVNNTNVSLTLGDFNTIRTAAMIPVYNSENVNAYVAGEYLLSDGPFDAPQNFNRLNFMSKLSFDTPQGDLLSIQFSRFYSQWDASGQIPQRLVDDGTISRFGAVDDTEGGQTSRTNIALNHTKFLSNHSYLKTSVFYSYYDFDLWSNFTFFLNDPVNGDQIRQTESRNIFGLNHRYLHEYDLGFGQMDLYAGAGFRYDNVDDNALSRTRNRTEILERVAFGDIDETNIYAYSGTSIKINNWEFNPSLRLDFFNFGYTNFLSAQYDNNTVKHYILSPKLNVFYNPNYQLQLYLKAGKGFHSNDSRVIVEQESSSIVPAAYSVDLGSVWKPISQLWINTAFWYLHLDQEFVYVGDEGIVEPSGRSRRKGIEVSARYQAHKNLYTYLDFNHTIARSIDEEEGNDYIPLAPDLTMTGGLNYSLNKKLNAGLKFRYIKNRPANEDNSIEALGYFINDFNISYNVWRGLNIGLTVENLFDREWNEAQFATESRLFNEVNPVEEIHFTPGVPRFIKVQVQYNLN